LFPFLSLSHSLQGHDTTKSGMAWALYLIGLHDDVQQKIYDEMRDIFGDDVERLATTRDLNEMKYLERVLKETLRLYPPVPNISRFLNEDVEIGKRCDLQLSQKGHTARSRSRSQADIKFRRAQSLRYKFISFIEMKGNFSVKKSSQSFVLCAKPNSDEDEGEEKMLTHVSACAFVINFVLFPFVFVSYQLDVLLLVLATDTLRTPKSLIRIDFCPRIWRGGSPLRTCLSALVSLQSTVASLCLNDSTTFRSLPFRSASRTEKLHWPEVCADGRESHCVDNGAQFQDQINAATGRH